MRGCVGSWVASSVRPLGSTLQSSTVWAPGLRRSSTKFLWRSFYPEVDSMGAMKTIMEGLDDYNMFSVPMPLVMFADACEHVARVCRLLRQPSGNALLAGNWWIRSTVSFSSCQLHVRVWHLPDWCCQGLWYDRVKSWAKGPKDLLDEMSNEQKSRHSSLQTPGSWTSKWLKPSTMSWIPATCPTYTRTRTQTLTFPLLECQSMWGKLKYSTLGIVADSMVELARWFAGASSVSCEDMDSIVQACRAACQQACQGSRAQVIVKWILRWLSFCATGHKTIWNIIKLESFGFE